MGTELTQMEFVLIFSPENCQFPTDYAVQFSALSILTSLKSPFLNINTIQNTLNYCMVLPMFLSSWATKRMQNFICMQTTKDFSIS